MRLEVVGRGTRNVGGLYGVVLPPFTLGEPALSHSRAQRSSLSFCPPPASSFALPWSKCIPAPTIMAGPDSSKTKSLESLSGFCHP